MTMNPAARGQSRFLSNTAALAVHMVFATLFTFLQVKILASYLPPERFGLFASLRGFSLLISTLAAAGLPLLLTRFFPELEARRRGRAALGMYGLSLAGAAGLLLVAWLVVSRYQANFLNYVDRSDLSGELMLWFWITTIGWSLKLIVYGGLNGLRRLTVHAALDVAALFAQLAWIFALRSGLTLPTLFKITGIVSLVEAVVGLMLILGFLLRRSRPERIGGEPASVDRAGARRYVSYWGWAVGLSVVAIAFSDVDRYFLSQVITLEMLALFHIGARVTRLSNRLLGVPNFAFQPEVTRLDAEGRAEQVRLATRVFMKFSAAVSVFAAAALIAFAGEILIFVSSREYVAAAPLLVLLALAMPLSALTAPLTTVMKALDRVRLALLCDLAWAGLYVGLLFLLCGRLGLIGAGLAAIVAGVAQLLLATGLSRPTVRPVFITSLAARLLGSAALVFAPLIVLEIATGWGTFELLFFAKLVLLAGAVWGYRKLLLAGRLFTPEENHILMEIFSRRGLGWVAVFVAGREEAPAETGDA